MPGGLQRTVSPVRAMLALVAACAAVRAALFFVYQPVVYPDTGTYHELAAQLLAWDFSGYVGVRTPGYPLLLMLAGQNHVLVWVLQSVLGIAVAVLLFRICYAHTASPALALAAGLAHGLAVNQLFFEANILSETLTTFFVVLAIACLVDHLAARRRGRAAGAGFASAMAALTRPGYLYLGPLLALLVLCFERGGRRHAAWIAVAFVLPVLGWAAFNKATIDYFGLSTNMGYGLTNHSGRFMEKAGDEHALLRDIYLKHRERKIAETGRSAVTIFLARDEMRERTGLDHIALSQRLAQLSLDLFAAHPDLYLASVAESWASFWAVPYYARRDSFTAAGAARVAEAAFAVQRPLLLAAYLVAIAAGVWVLAAGVMRRLTGAAGLTVPVIVAAVLLAASVLQALAEYGENPRYGIPTQSLAVLLVILALSDLYRGIRARRVVAHTALPASAA